LPAAGSRKGSTQPASYQPIQRSGARLAGSVCRSDRPRQKPIKNQDMNRNPNPIPIQYRISAMANSHAFQMHLHVSFEPMAAFTAAPETDADQCT